MPERTLQERMLDLEKTQQEIATDLKKLRQAFYEAKLSFEGWRETLQVRRDIPVEVPQPNESVTDDRESPDTTV